MLKVGTVARTRNRNGTDTGQLNLFGWESPHYEDIDAIIVIERAVLEQTY